MTDSKKVIAICDDMPHVLERTKKNLEEAGYTVLSFRAFPETDILNNDGSLNEFNNPDWLTGHFSDFQRFIDVLKNPRAALGDENLPDHVDMLVSDGQMGIEIIAGNSQDDPKKSGIELSVRMRKAGLETPIAIYTGIGSEVKRVGMSQELGRLAEEHGFDAEAIRNDIPVIDKNDTKELLAFIEQKTASRSSVAAQNGDIGDAQHLGLLGEAPCRALD